MVEISIIVPVYNVELYLKRCIDSILKQSYSNFELILIDDGSTDNSGNICDKYAELDKRVVVIHQSNLGLSMARNAGISLAFKNQSKYLFFVDSDDWLHVNTLAWLYSAIKEKQFNVAGCLLKKVYSFEKDCNYDYDNSVKKIITPENFFVKSPADATAVCGKLFKKELFSIIRFPEKKLHEDVFLTYRILFKEKQIVLVNLPLYYYFQRDTSITHTSCKEERKDFVIGQRLRMKFFKENGFRKAFAYEYNNPSCIAIEILALNENLVPTIEKKRKLKKRLRRELKNKKIDLHKQTWLYEVAYPNLMKVYWGLHAIIRKINRV